MRDPTVQVPSPPPLEDPSFRAHLEVEVAVVAAHKGHKDAGIGARWRLQGLARIAGPRLHQEALVGEGHTGTQASRPRNPKPESTQASGPLTPTAPPQPRQDPGIQVPDSHYPH